LTFANKTFSVKKQSDIILKFESCPTIKHTPFSNSHPQCISVSETSIDLTVSLKRKLSVVELILSNKSYFFLFGDPNLQMVLFLRRAPKESNGKPTQTMLPCSELNFVLLGAKDYHRFENEIIVVRQNQNNG